MSACPHWHPRKSAVLNGAWAVGAKTSHMDGTVCVLTDGGVWEVVRPPDSDPVGCPWCARAVERGVSAPALGHVSGCPHVDPIPVRLDAPGLRNLPARFWLWWHMRHAARSLTGAVWACSCGSTYYADRAAR